MKLRLALLAFVVLVSGCIGGDSVQDDAGAVMPGGSSAVGTQDIVEQSAEGNIVKIMSSGFSPQSITIQKGDIVTWVNEDSEDHWPASATHPSHKEYPGSGMEKCGTSEEEGIFDACEGISSNGAWSFEFDEIGTWRYHDHLNPSFFGTVIVQ